MNATLNVPKRPKALALMSGGLDSSLAARIVKDFGVEVIGLHFTSPFACRENIEAMAKQIGIPLLIREKGESYVDVLKHPKYGYGKALNPCIDCRIFMFDLAEQIRLEEQADFLITGEVLGQRPKSQIRSALRKIEHDTPESDRILRPLSAHRFQPTLAEREGWVDRNQLYNLVGRSRKAQLALADKFGIKDFPSPGGGCLLTETSFRGKLSDFLKHDPKAEGRDRLSEAELLRFGRHFRVDKLKVVLGRNQEDNEKLQATRLPNTFLFSPRGFRGPLALAIGPLSAAHKIWVGQLIARYASGGEETWEIEITAENQKLETLLVKQTLAESELERTRL